MTRIKTAVIPVAGMGTRFLPATKAIPKEMIPILNRPMIEYVVDEAVASGIETIVFVSARGKEAIENHFDRSPEMEAILHERGESRLLSEFQRTRKDVKIVAVRQGLPLGLGHAVLQAESVVGSGPFAVLLGDDLIDSPGQPCLKQLIEQYEATGKPIVGVMEVERAAVSRYGVIAAEGISDRLHRVTDLIEKPAIEEAPSRLAIPGRYILPCSIFRHLREIPKGKGGEYQLTDALRRLCTEDGMLAYQFEGRRFDTGNLLGYLEAVIYFAMKDPSLSGEFREIVERYLK